MPSNQQSGPILPRGVVTKRSFSASKSTKLRNEHSYRSWLGKVVTQLSFAVTFAILQMKSFGKWCKRQQVTMKNRLPFKTPAPNEAAELLDWLVWWGIMAVLVTAAVAGHAIVSQRVSPWP